MMLKRTLLLLAMALVAPLVHAASDDELLDPEVAFKLDVQAVDANTVRATWTPAEGYYMYRDKFGFSTDTPGAKLGEAKYNKGEMKDDEFFGRIEVYHHQAIIDIPVNGAAGKTVDLTLKGQGCNGPLGVCYPPMTRKVSLKLPAAGAVDKLSGLAGSLGLGNQDDELLPPDQAFAFELAPTDGNHLLGRWTIADGYYMYKDKIKFSIQSGDGISIAGVDLPKGKVHEDEFFGKIEVYYNQLEGKLRLARDRTDATDITVTATYQGCSEAQGVCYPPITKDIKLALPAGQMGSPAAAPTSGGAMSEQDTLAASLAGGSIWTTILIFFGAGLLLTFTPCVFPMIPIISSIIAGQGENLTTRKAFTMSLVYVLAMALTYTVAGVIMGLIGENVQAIFQNPWVLGTFAAIFLLLSLSMFGFYELQMPGFIQSRLTEISNRQQGGTLVGVAVMGLLSALIVGPCVTAPLVGALIYIGQTGDAVLGGAALFALSMGMGVPLIIIGTSAGKILPRAGGWMDTVKAVFGVMLIGVAIWMLERVVPDAVALALWAVLAIVSAIYMGALEPIREGMSGWFRLWKGLGVVLLIYGALMLVGVSAGGGDPLQPLRGVGFGGGSVPIGQSHELNFKRVQGLDQVERELAAAKSAGQPVVLDLYADWCVSCKEFEKYTFSDPGVQAVLSKAVLLQADVTDNTDQNKALLKRFGLIGPPSIMFFGPDGVERKQYRVVGFMEAEQFRDHAQRALQ
jgi:thiol:disulfide interchange protein DsbD